MDLTGKREGCALTVSLSGDMCADCIPATEAFLNENCAGVTELTLDFGGVKKLTKEGLMLLLSTRKKLCGSMRMVNVAEDIYEKLEEQGITTLIDVAKAE